MEDNSKRIEDRIKYLEDLIKEKEKSTCNAPAEHIRISGSPDRIDYYLITPGELNGRYIPDSQSELVRALAQKDYDITVLRSAKKELRALQRLIKNFPKRRVEDIYEQSSPARQAVVSPVRCSDAQFREEWESSSFEQKPLSDSVPSFLTDKGDHVRSKSELMIANLLLQYDIPYYYEKPLFLSCPNAPYFPIHPDFTVLNLRLRKTFYWEHLGMMDDPVYSESAANRLSLYQQEELFPGEQLILTFESRQQPLQTQTIRHMIQEYLL